MEGIAGVQARISALEQRLSTLRGPQPGPFDALLQQSAGIGLSAVAVAQPTAPATSSAWAGLQRPAALQPAAVQEALRAAGVSPGVLPGAAPVSALQNGRLPASALQPIGGGEALQPDAADRFLALREAAAQAGVSLPVNDSYRSFAEQQEVAARKGLYSQGGLAARPGTSSHGLGLSVDLQLDDDAQRWMRANAGRFGFVEDVPREPWHWTYKPS